VRVREADANSYKRQRFAGEYHHGHDSDDDDGGYIALHARRFYTDLRIIRSRHANTSAERNRPCPVRVRKDVKVTGDCVQSGMHRFGHRSRTLHGVGSQIAITTVPRLDEKRVRLCAGGLCQRAGRPVKFSADHRGVLAVTVFDDALLMELEARGVEPLSSSLSAQTSTCLSDDKF
jgi:hypothetical protein